MWWSELIDRGYKYLDGYSYQYHAEEFFHGTECGFADLAFEKIYRHQYDVNDDQIDQNTDEDIGNGVDRAERHDGGQCAGASQYGETERHDAA